MKIIDFNILSVNDQLQLLYSEGVFLSKRKTGNNAVLLYQLDQLYVEIFYSKYRRQVIRINCTRQPDVLQPYLSAIAIDNIFEK